MKTFMGLLAVVVTMCAAASASAGDCTCQGAYVVEHRSHLRRLCDRLTPQRSACGQGKTHFDMGCTNARADWVFVFGNCCEFFDHPETYPGSFGGHRWGWK